MQRPGRRGRRHSEEDRNVESSARAQNGSHAVLTALESIRDSLSVRNRARRGPFAVLQSLLRSNSRATCAPHPTRYPLHLRLWLLACLLACLRLCATSYMYLSVLVKYPLRSTEALSSWIVFILHALSCLHALERIDRFYVRHACKSQSFRLSKVRPSADQVTLRPSTICLASSLRRKRKRRTRR